MQYWWIKNSAILWNQLTFRMNAVLLEQAGICIYLYNPSYGREYHMI
jgi:hypothetical protein